MKMMTGSYLFNRETYLTFSHCLGTVYMRFPLAHQILGQMMGELLFLCY